jgi:hypothetical protein
MSVTDSSQRRVDQLPGVPRARPVLAVAAFVGPLVITLFMFWLDRDHILVVLPCVSLAVASTLLCIQLLAGNVVPFRWLLLVAVVCALLSGRQWYGFVTLAVGTGLCLIVMDRYVGWFVPLLDPSSQHHRVFPIGRLWKGADGGSTEAA